ncbi:hypothetical protein LBMAG42_16870 [Deltaproteobacteria bacterium]|nr:hypothetical protein LBMAG42_16870 [Deltaproteobacteria bacterium]
MHCSYRPKCPGCPLAELSYPDQLLRKQARLAAAFSRYGHLPAVPSVLGSATTEGYRHRLKLPVQVEEDRVSVGLYDHEGQHILDTPECIVLEPGLRAALAVVRAWLVGKRDVHSIDLRRSSDSGELQLVLAVVGGELRGGKKALASLVERLPALKSIALSKADPDRKRVMGSAPAVVYGKQIIEETIGATRYHIHPGAFFQVDPKQAERLHKLVFTAVGNAQTVLDLYSGVGAYALMLAPGRKRVVAVEEVPQAARSAAEVAPRNVEVISRRVEDLKVDEPFDVVVLNPARRGSDVGVLVKAASLAKRMVYVSCGPETLARDLDILAAHGMRVVNVQPVDLFPQTPEVETVVTLERGPAVREWKVPGGQARGPWGSDPSGAIGRPDRVLALILGETPANGEIPGGRFKRIAKVASHSLVRIELSGGLVPALAGFARNGHGIAGRDPKTAKFFAEKAGLLRPFVHIERAGGAVAPLHGDLVAALVALGATETEIARAGGGDVVRVKR